MCLLKIIFREIVAAWHLILLNVLVKAVASDAEGFMKNRSVYAHESPCFRGHSMYINVLCTKTLITLGVVPRLVGSR